MAKEINYVESRELLSVSQELKKKYYNLIGYVDLDKIFFAFKGGDYPEWFRYEIVGLQNDWVKFASPNTRDVKTYCVAMTFDYYEKSQGSQLEWTLIDLLYSCEQEMKGKIRRKDVHEYSVILKTLEELGVGHDWRENYHLPHLLGDETIIFGVENNESI